MARMTDILKDIQDEFDAVEVAFFSHSGAIDIEQGTRKQSDYPEESDPSNHRGQSTSSLNDITIPTSTGTTLELEVSLKELSLDENGGATECQRCGFATHNGQCSGSSNKMGSEFRYSTQRPKTTSSTAGDRTSAVTPAWVEGSGKKDFVWGCGQCGDGPYGGWQVSCQACGSPRI
jgi:hypothetical protein